MIVLPRSISWPLAFIGGQLLALCYAPYEVGVMVWFWLLPLLGALWFGGGGSAKRGFGIGWAGGLGFWIFNVKWIAEVEGVSPVLGFCLLVALASFLALYVGVWGAVASKWLNPFRNTSVEYSTQKEGSLQQKVAARILRQQEKVSSWKLAKQSLNRSLLLAALWVSLEWIRSWFLTGFTWSGVGVAFHDSLVLAQGADLIGAMGLSFLPVFVSAVLLQVGIRLVNENRVGQRRAHLDFGIAVLVVALFFVYGMVRVSQFHRIDSHEFDVLVVQGNVPQSLKWDPDEQYALYEKYSSLTQAGIDRVQDQAVTEMQEGEVMTIPKIDMVLWPESSFPEPVWYQPEGGTIKGQYNEMYVDNHLRSLGEFVLVTGINYLPAELGEEGEILLTSGKPFYNSMALIEGDFKDLKVYHKKHLVPFGEYLPLEDHVPFVKSIFAMSTKQDYVDSFSRGGAKDPVSISLRGEEIQIIPTICYEDTVAPLVRKLVRSEPQIILNVTNDGWFGESEAALQHMATARFRAIELRRPLVRSANTGVSVVIQANGSAFVPGRPEKQMIVDDEGSPFVADSMYAKVFVPKEGPMTLYALWGNWFVYLCLGVSFIHLIFEVAKRRRFLSGSR